VTKHAHLLILRGSCFNWSVISATAI